MFLGVARRLELSPCNTVPGSPRTLTWLAWFESSQPRRNCDQLRMHARTATRRGMHAGTATGCECMQELRQEGACMREQRPAANACGSNANGPRVMAVVRAGSTGRGILPETAARPGTATQDSQTNNTHNPLNRPSIGTTHRPSTGHHRKSSPRVMSHNTHLHTKPWPAPHRPSRVIPKVLSANAAQHASQLHAGRAALQHRHHPR